MDLKDKYQIDLKFISKPGLIFEDFKFEIVETKDEGSEDDSLDLVDKFEQEINSIEPLKAKSKISTEEVGNVKPEGKVAQAKRKYSKRKPSPRRGQSRTRGKRSYSPRRKPDIEKVSSSTRGSNQPLKSEEKINVIPSEVEPSIIPLPPPFIRSETTPFTDSEKTEGENSSSMPD